MVPASSLASPCSSGGGSLSPQGAALSRVEVAMQASLRQGPAPIKDAAVVPKCVAGSSAAAMWAVLTKFQNNWMLYCTIPVVAGLLNWATNKLAVQMIFYPLNFWGLKIKTWPETPLGLIGWTGIVPAKARTMAQRMVRMVTSSLIDVREVARRLQPAAVAALLQPLLPAAIEKAAHEGGVGWVASSGLTAGWTQRLAGEFVTSFTVKMQDNIQDIMDLEHLVVTKMVQEKKLLVELFQTCGKVELAFVVRSGLYLGFLLGLVQMGVWVCWDPWWSLAVGGAAVGYVTNFIAIKSIFEPVEPVKVGGWKLQGLFLTRQHEVAAEFARFLTGKVLTPDDIWREILYGERRERFEALLEQHIRDFAGDFASVRLRLFSPASRSSTFLPPLLLPPLPSSLHAASPCARCGLTMGWAACCGICARRWCARRAEECAGAGGAERQGLGGRRPRQRARLYPRGLARTSRPRPYPLFFLPPPPSACSENRFK